MEIAYNIIFVVAIGVLCASAALLFIHSAQEHLYKWKLFKELPNIPAPQINKKYKVGLIVVVTFIFVYLFTKNVAASIFMVALIILIPSQLAYRYKQKQKTNSLQHLGAAIQMFASVYSEEQNIAQGLLVAGKAVHGPVGKAFITAYTDLAFGKAPDYVYDNLAQNLSWHYGKRFCKLLKICQKQGTSVTNLFLELGSKIAIAQEHADLLASETNNERKFNLILLIAPIPLYLVCKLAVPQIDDFLLTSTFGRVIVTCWPLSIILGILVNRIINE